MKCTLCPRSCNTDRSASPGFCRMGSELRVAKAYLHKFEEPSVSGTRGSGTVFFTGCNMRCCFCQNYSVSQEDLGKTITVPRLAEIFRELEAQGAHNINLVTPTVWTDKIAEAIDMADVSIPFVYNCGGYESVSAIRNLGKRISVFLPDIKFYSSELSARYVNAPDYFEKAVAALEVMLEIAGAPTLDEKGIIKSGVIVRHLVMPSHYRDSIKILEELASRFGADAFLLSLMSQYLPMGRAADFPEINRRLTTFEYTKVTDRAAALGFKGYAQERSSATDEYIPDFDLSGV